MDSRDGVEIHFETRGTGDPALVFVHGWSCDRGYWKHQLDHFARNHQVVTIDLAGHGESGLDRKNWTLQGFAEDLVAVVEALHLKKLVLIGHSMGGDVIVEAGKLLGDRIVGLIWVDVYRQLGHPSTPEQTERFLAPFRADFVRTTNRFVRGMFLTDSDKALVDWVAADMSAGGEVALKILEVNLHTFERQVTSTLPSLRAPIVSINPDNRPVDIAGMLRHGVRVILMPAVGHFPMMEKPDSFNQVLSKVIEELVEPNAKR